MRRVRKAAFILVLFLSLASVPGPSRAGDGEGGAVAFGPETGIAHPHEGVSPPAVAVDGRGRVYMVWKEETDGEVGVYLVHTDDGDELSSPVRVDTPEYHPGSVHGAPTLAASPEGDIYVAWTRPVAGGRFASVLVVRASHDRGSGFTPPVRVNDNAEPASAGFESLDVGPGGVLYAAWLDGREKKDGGSAATYFARSVDGGATFTENVRIDGDSCPCCKTDVESSGDQVHVSWRKVFPGSIREIVYARSADRGESFGPSVIVGDDEWFIEGCPHRGPSIGSAGEGVQVFWYSEADETPGVYLGRTFEPAGGFSKELLDTTPNTFPDHPVMESSGGALYMAWQETTPVFSRVYFEHRRGGERFRVRMDTGTRRSSDPAVAVNSRGDVAVAWTRHEIMRARTVLRVGRTTR